MQVKGNQKSLEENCRQIIADQTPIDIFEDHEKGHGRIEYRKTEIYNTGNQGVSLDLEWANYAKIIVSVTRERSVFSTKDKVYKTSREVSLYLATFKSSAKVFHHAIRAHWGIENRNHNVRDTTMKEDLSRIRINPGNFSVLRSFALNIMRKNNVNNISDAIYSNALNLPKFIKKCQHLF